MNEQDFEGTLILEKLAELGQLEAFYEAIDSDDEIQVIKILKNARIDFTSIQLVLKLMREE